MANPTGADRKVYSGCGSSKDRVRFAEGHSGDECGEPIELKEGESRQVADVFGVKVIQDSTGGLRFEDREGAEEEIGKVRLSYLKRRVFRHIERRYESLDKFGFGIGIPESVRRGYP